MNLMSVSALVAAGGAIGSVLRFWSVAAAGRLWPGFPMGVMLVNIAGSFVMGAATGWILARAGGAAEGWRAFLTTGVLGGFTTFSAFSLDFHRLLEQQRWLGAAVYAGGSVGISLAALAAGLALARRIWAV